MLCKKIHNKENKIPFQCKDHYGYHCLILQHTNPQWFQFKHSLTLLDGKIQWRSLLLHSPFICVACTLFIIFLKHCHILFFLLFIYSSFWIAFAVSTSLLYGFYGDARLILGPSSSRLIQSRSLFVKQIEVTNEYTNTNNDIHLYAFNEKPELNSEINWTTSKFLVVEAYSRKVWDIVFYSNVVLKPMKILIWFFFHI